MKYKVFIGGQFKFVTLVEASDEMDASESAVNDFYDRHPDLEIDGMLITVEETEEEEEDV